VTVFDRIKVNVIDVPRKIVLVPQRVLPIAALRNPAFAFAQTTGRDPLAVGQAAGETRFDELPADREIGVAGG